MTQISDPIRTDLQDRAARLFQPGGSGREWFLLHARPRCEKKATETCLDLEIRHFLPLRRSVHRRRGRRYSFDVPLFPGYLFGCCDQPERIALLRSGFLVRTIDVVDQQQFLDELASVYLACWGETDLRLYPPLKRGRLVRIKRGPLTGTTGRISGRKTAFRLILNVSILGSAVALEVDAEDVEPV